MIAEILQKITSALSSLEPYVTLCIGLVLGFGIDRLKMRLNRKSLRKILEEELHINRKMLPDFRGFVSTTIAAISDEHAPNLRPIHFLRSCYDSHYPEILPILDPAERSSYHLIYEYLAICNEVSNRVAEIMFQDNSEEEKLRQLKLYAGTMNKVHEITLDLERYIQLHLEGSPKDFFQINPDGHNPR